MLYMIIERYKDKEAVYSRFAEKGRMARCHLCEQLGQ